MTARYLDATLMVEEDTYDVNILYLCDCEVFNMKKLVSSYNISRVLAMLYVIQVFICKPQVVLDLVQMCACAAFTFFVTRASLAVSLLLGAHTLQNRRAMYNNLFANPYYILFDDISQQYLLEQMARCVIYALMCVILYRYVDFMQVYDFLH